MKIIDDKRPIQAIEIENYYTFDVSKKGPSKICPYEESGEMACNTWFEIWYDEHLAYRVNGKYVRVIRY